MTTPFHYGGQPVTAAQAATILNDRRAEWRRSRLDRKRERDARDGALHRQIWAMIRWRT